MARVRGLKRPQRIPPNSIKGLMHRCGLPTKAQIGRNYRFHKKQVFYIRHPGAGYQATFPCLHGPHAPPLVPVNNLGPPPFPFRCRGTGIYNQIFPFGRAIRVS